jgi:hypothetical protein
MTQDAKGRELTDWSKDQPPAGLVGWLNASTTRNPNVRRWWDGRVFSRGVAVNVTTDAEMRKRQQRPATMSELCDIEWRGLAQEPQA